MRISTREIDYVEVHGHYLYYHAGNETYDTRGNMSELEEVLREEKFVRCNNCYLVNLRAVRDTSGNDVNVNGELLQISRPRKREFMNALAEFWGNGGSVSNGSK